MSQRLNKSYEISQFKAMPDQGEGTFEALVSIFGNVDLQGDRVMPGAFGKSLEAWRASGDPIPILWSHNWGDPYAHIGYADPKDVSEVMPGKAGRHPGGLLVKGHLDVEKPFAKQVYDLLAGRRVKEFSFSYDVPAGGERRGKDGANELLVLDIIEVGPTLKGANPETLSLGVKSDLEVAASAQLEVERAKASWDGAAAMQRCHDRADFAKIAFERANDSDPDSAAHWALPHHNSPGADANPAGVSAALGALNGARGGKPDLKDAGAARRHLERHQGSEEKAIGDGNARHLIDWFNAGADGAIHWGTPGDWAECVAVASAHMTPEQAKGFCQNRHQEATGMSTAEHAHNEGKAFEGKPWHVEERDGKYCVVKNDTNEEVHCHATREEAEAQVRALYANEKGSAEEHHEKAGRVIGAKALGALKSKLADALDEWAAEINGTSSGGGDDGEPQSKGDRRDYAIGYVDGQAGTPRREIAVTAAYERGYDEGAAELAKVGLAELEQFKAKIDALTGK